MSPVDRRTFLKGLAIASAGAAGVTAADAAQAPASPAQARGAQWRKVPCTLCSVGCGLQVRVEGGRAVAVQGDPESPVSRGLACVKGYHAIQSLYGSDRITRAMIRRNGTLVPVPLAEALDLVANRLRDTARQHGKGSVALYGPALWSATDAYIGAKLFTGALESPNVDTGARLDSASGIAGLQGSFGMDGGMGSYEDIDHADVFVLWNSNLAETHPVLFSRMLERRRTNPAVRIIDLSTRTTRTSYGADQAMLIAPGGELAIANAICQEIVARRQMHREFVERNVAFKRAKPFALATPSDALAAEEAIDASWGDYVEFLSAHTPERAQQLTGLPADYIRWLATLYSNRSLKVLSVWGEGVNRQARGMWANNALYNLHLLTGKVGSPGNNAFCVDAAVGGGAHGGGVLTQRGRDAVGMFGAFDGGDIRFLWVHSANPVAELPGGRRYARAATRDDRFLVVTDAYPTATTDAADVVLPAALWIEREGVFVNAERRAQFIEQLVAPPGDATSGGWQLMEVARRLGFTQQLPWTREQHAQRAWEEHRSADARRALPTIDEMRDSGGSTWPRVKGQETKWRYNAAYDASVDSGRGSFDFYGHDDHRAWIWMRAPEPAVEQPGREYPFLLETGAVLEHSGSGTITRRIPVLHRAVPRSYVELNSADARRMGIRNGNMVRLTSPRGSLTLEARIDYRSQPAPGRLFVPYFDEGVPAQTLMGDARSRHSGQPETGRCVVRMERTSGTGVT